MSTYVPPSGPLNARIALVGEAPGEEEVSTGIPFTGSSGRLLNDMLANAGIDRRSCYVTNVCKTRPSGNDFGQFYLDKQRRQPSPELLKSIEELKNELRGVKANIIVPLGAEALRALTGKVNMDKGIAGGPIMNWRGSLLKTELGKMCPTLHPAYVLRMYKSRITVEQDLKRVCEESISPELKLPIHTFELNPSFGRVMEFLSQKPARFAFDIETSGPYVRCLGISERKDHAICIPFMSNQHYQQSSSLISLAPTQVQRNSHWSPEQEYEIIKKLDEWFSDESISKIAQNFPFDSLVLARDFGLDCSSGFSLDTMVAAHTCYSELPKGLDYLCSIYTRVPYYSDFDNSVDAQLWKYNCYDCAVTLEIADKLVEEMQSLGVYEFYKSHVHPAILSYTRAETRGIRVNVEALAEIRKNLDAELIVLRAKMDQLSGGTLKNPNSPDQVAEFFYTKLGLKPVMQHKTRKVTTDKHARDKLRQRHPELADIFNTMDELKSKSTLKSSFVDRPIGEDNKARTHYNVAGTKGGRLSSGEDREEGPVVSKGAFGDVVNMQNVPRGSFRRIFIPEPGFSFIKADLSQAEWRIVVYRAPIHWAIERYKVDPNYNVHKMIASKVFNKPEHLIQKKLPAGQLGLSEYDLAKNGAYGTMYGMREGTASVTWKVPFNTAKFVLGEIRGLIPELEHNYWPWIKSQLLSNQRGFTNPFGRRFTFFDRFDDEMERDARSLYPQGTVGGIINAAWNQVDNDWDDDEAYPHMQVHDEIVAQARTELVISYAHKLKKAMEIPILIGQEWLTIPVEVSIGQNWYDTVLLEQYEKEHSNGS